MRQTGTKKRAAIKKRSRAAKKKRQQLMRRIYLAGGAVFVLALVVLCMPFFLNSPRASAPDVLAPYESQPSVQPRYTPVPTPLPTPTPEPTPEPTPVPTPSPTPYAFQTSGRKLNPKKKMIALTFDDGPSAKTTDEILKILKNNGAKGTFFMLGDCAMRNPSVVKRVAEAGHQIGTHTYNHMSLIRHTPEEMLEELNKSIWAISEAGGGTPTILRPPYGNTDEIVCATVVMPMINWSVDTLDWKSKNAKQVAEHLLNDVADGAIVLMHDIYPSTAAGLKKALPTLKKRGYQFVTIDELFESRETPLKFGTVYTKCSPPAKAK